MIDLELEIFETIKAREVIGETPTVSEFSKKLENAYNYTENKLQSDNSQNLQELLQKSPIHCYRFFF